jgi:hypothetical protein
MMQQISDPGDRQTADNQADQAVAAALATYAALRQEITSSSNAHSRCCTRPTFARPTSRAADREVRACSTTRPRPRGSAALGRNALTAPEAHAHDAVSIRPDEIEGYGAGAHGARRR